MLRHPPTGNVLQSAFNFTSCNKIEGACTLLITHEVPAAFSLAAFGLHKLRRRDSVFPYLFVFALATPVAILASWYGLLSVSKLWVGLTLLFSAGTFTYVATVDLLPNVHNPSLGRVVLWQILVAVAVMIVLVVVLKWGGLAHHIN